MKLLSDIINELVDTDKTIGSPILKAKVLASRIQNKELLDWLNKEFGGYGISEKLPDYRIFTCHLKGSYINETVKYSEVSIATGGLDEKILNDLNYMRFYQSIGSLEQSMIGNSSGSLEQDLSAELISYLERNVIDLGNPAYRLISARKTLPSSAINEVLSVVRNKLLDLVLKLDEEFGSITEIEDLRKRSQEIQSIVNNTIITNSGEGSVINTGEKARIKSSIRISKGNKTHIKDKIREVGLSEEDALNLLEVIDDDIPDIENNRFREKVNIWIQSMLSKALNGSWNIGIGAAGNVLSEMIQQYYGM